LNANVQSIYLNATFYLFIVVVTNSYDPVSWHWCWCDWGRWQETTSNEV